jgi:hypothetical protein
VVVSLAQWEAAGSAQAYTMQILSESYFCGASASYGEAYYDNQGILVWDPPIISVSNTGSSAYASVGPASAYSSISGLGLGSGVNSKTIDYMEIVLSASQHIVGNAGPHYVYESAYSYISGELKFLITKDSGDMEDTMTMPFQISTPIILNGKQISGYYADMAFPLGLNTLQFTYGDGWSEGGNYNWMSRTNETWMFIGFWPEGINVTTSPVPLPGTVLLFGAGLGRLAIYRRRKMNAKN